MLLNFPKSGISIYLSLVIPLYIGHGLCYLIFHKSGIPIYLSLVKTLSKSYINNIEHNREYE